MRILIAAAAPLALLLIAAAPPRPRTARCVITAPQERPYGGPCAFLAEGKGSFSLMAPPKRAFFPGTDTLSVWIVSPGVAEVRGLTAAGINSRWGEARRSRRDPACWDGGDFRICVY